MSRIIVRPAHPGDAMSLHRLNEAFNGPGTNTPERIRAALEKGGQELVFLAESDGQAIGFCCVQPLVSFCYPTPCAELTELYVDTPYRRMGAAAALVKFAEESVKVRFGADEMHLLTGPDNQAAQAFYRTVGYEQDGELRFVKPLRP